MDSNIFLLFLSYQGLRKKTQGWNSCLGRKNYSSGKELDGIYLSVRLFHVFIMWSIKRFKGQNYIFNIFIIRVLQKAEKSQISSFRNSRKIMENCSKFRQSTTLLNFLSKYKVTENITLVVDPLMLRPSEYRLTFFSFLFTGKSSKKWRMMLRYKTKRKQWY